jgi:xeroderma pigmentosum group C-complementing protein
VGGAAGDDEDGEDDTGAPAGPTVALYGLWQTEAHEEEAAADGRVPVNDFGNVDLTHGGAPPAGSTHVALPRAAAVARALGMHAPPALVGFERYAGRSTPVLHGVVVADEHAEALRDACLADERAREERALQRATDEAAKHWRTLLTAVWVRRRVEAEYGAGAAPKAAGAAAAVEVMELDSDGEVVADAVTAPAAPAAPAAAGLARSGVQANVEQM